jgi:uncharacterized protein involved in tellurium resistance
LQLRLVAPRRAGHIVTGEFLQQKQQHWRLMQYVVIDTFVIVTASSYPSDNTHMNSG